MSARPELIGEVDEVERLLAVMASANPSVYMYVGIPREPDGRLNRSSLQAAVRHGFRIVRWHLDQEEQNTGHYRNA